ncbi:hypothetical protein EDC30_10987 [Paucimonas lemoignei]|uniref:Phage portal protein, lambda family n=1 Tax=Paucimonas lemoignei TaxID=29443 RepID=A0A4R3HS78_PAULE|nr:hypothetical protein [Paucimonas lemoignei]TCS35788.1 hypothetical protein EDC30_10987 [Paucimonas lemoignei]
MNLLKPFIRLGSMLGGLVPGQIPQAASGNTAGSRTTEAGLRVRPEDRFRHMFREFWVDPDVRQAILDIREADRLDGRVKMIHSRVARDIIKSGLVLQQSKPDERITAAWIDFCRRTSLNRPEKLKSDARGLIMEGNLPLQVVINQNRNICSLVRMPSETIVPQVDESGRFKDPTKAYRQLDIVSGLVSAEFALWQLFLVRFDPDNFDDMGSMGRPFLDANRTTWRKLCMTEEDLVIRRRVRAPVRHAHVLEGATEAELQTYEAKITSGQHEITTDYFLNKKGAVSAIQGDANLDQVADIALLLDAFFSGGPMPKGLAGYTEGLNRDILEDLKKDYFDEIDVLQDTLSFGYEQVFRFELLLQGIVAGEDDFCVSYAERRTESPNQAADRALKLQALGLPDDMIYEELGYDPVYVDKRRKFAINKKDPYPEEMPDPARSRVKITPSNARKGESATSITNR